MKLMDPSRYAELKASGHLPSPQGVAFAIIKLMQRDDYQVNDLVHLVQSDPAIAGRILKFANAAAFSSGRAIVSLSKAIIALGAFRVRDLVLAFSILHSNRSGTCANFDFSAFWSHSLATAIACKNIAPLAQIAAEENFTTGLLSSVGELALASIFPKAYSEVLVQAGGDREWLLTLEQSAFATDHRELGATMLTEWGLPEIMVTATYHCEAPNESGFPDGSRYQLLTRSLHFSRALADICIAPDEQRWSMVPDLFTNGAHLGILAADLTLMADRVVQEWQEWGHNLQLKTRELPPFADLLVSTPPLNRRETFSDVDSNASQSATGPHLRILLVGLPQLGAAALAADLEGDGHTVRHAENGMDGLIMALREAPEVVIADLDAPEIDGLSLCRSLRESPLGKDIHVMLIADLEDESRVLQAVESGADDVLFMPVTVSLLRLRLRTAERLQLLRLEIRRGRNANIHSSDEWADTHQRLVKAALTDPLTQLPNRRHGLDFLASEWVFARANNLPLACMMLDIDHFKSINDRYGHDAGDALLRRMGEVLRRCARTNDLVFRYGGEEFQLICPNTELPAALRIAERIRRSVEKEHFVFEEQLIAATISIGVAAIKPAHANSEALVQDADRALYRAKDGGRNRVEK
ncbi:MAG: diguanylate cyclase [Sulfuricella sp.]|nr:diguanylate cyclase [Sulfuricella sp.]